METAEMAQQSRALNSLAKDPDSTHPHNGSSQRPETPVLEDPLYSSNLGRVFRMLQHAHANLK